MMLMTTSSCISTKMTINLVINLVMLSMLMIELVAFVLETRVITGGNDNADGGIGWDEDVDDDDDCFGWRLIE